MKGYYRFPTIHSREIIFVSEDDLWSLNIDGKKAIRLTTTKGSASKPFFSPNGKFVAFSGTEEGVKEIYLMDSYGGINKRLTYLSANSNCVGWTDDGKIIFSTNAKQINARVQALFTVDLNGNITELPYGPANHISFQEKGKGVVIGRNTADPARWKRYRGGTAGEIWIDNGGNFNFKKIIDIKTNLTCPMWIDGKIYFISDHEGIGNIYSCNTDGKNIKRHTAHNEFYVRNASTDGKNIIYHSGGDLYLLNVKANDVKRLDFKYNSPKKYIDRKFVSGNKYLEDFTPSSDGKKIAFSARGSVFGMDNFEGPVYQFGTRSDARYRLPKFLNKDKNIAVITDEMGEESIKIFKYGKGENGKSIKKDIGRVAATLPSPDGNYLALINHRYEVILIDIKKRTSKVIHKNKYFSPMGLNWSPDGSFLAYSAMIGKRRMAILVYDIKKQKDNVITNPILQDFNPCFSLDGKYLYFISARELDPVGDKIQFEASFPRTDKIYVIPLRKDVQVPTAFGAIPDEKERQQKKGGAQEDMSRIDEKEEKVKVQIDFKNIKDRVALMPLPISIYEQIAVSKDRIFALAFPIEGALSEDFFSSEKKPSAKIIAYDLKKKKVEIFFAGASYFYLTKDKIFIRIGSEIRVFPNSVPITPEVLSKEGKEGGNIDITRAKILVEPLDEWRQMYKEAWRLQRDNFWNEKMSDIDWNLIFKRYFKLIDKIGSRGEFSDLVWEMQGELGTSHCYEFGGDYHKPPVYKVGFLGGEFKWDNQNKGYKITNIISGDTWNNKFNSPLQTPGANISEGEIIREIDGIKVKKNVSIERMLLNKAKTCIELSIYDPKAKKERAVFIDTIGSEINLRYRNWVEKNREYVHKKTNGKIGYVHIPDMGPYGFSEFHRYFLSEIEYDGLVVDIRYNGGGNVSQLILEKLARKRIGYDIQRWGQPEPYPTDSVMGQIIVLTNEHAGSDGDIFSHCSKLLKLGKLIGKRTWGGVIGIWPRHFLSDGAVTTQPEFSFWFKDVGWGVENYGTDPDIEVDNRPKDYKSGKDRQLDVTIEEIMKEYKENPPKMPKFDKRPSRKLPKIR